MSKYSEEVREGAAKCAAYIREHGWCQGSLMSIGGAVCMWGATNAVCDTEEYAVDAAVKQEIGTSIPAWNDAPGRTKEEVLAVFDRIANS